MSRAPELEGLVAVVTGGNRGIGLGIARSLGSAGAAVSLWARDAARNEAALEELTAEGFTVQAVTCDVTDEQSVVEAAAQTMQRFGRIDACVANAGGGGHRPFLETSLRSWERGIAINLTGAFLTFRETAKLMVAGEHAGALVAVSSCAAVHASPEMHDYAAAKAGLGGLVRSVAAELGPFGIRANVLMPGFTSNSTMSPETVPESMVIETLASISAGRWNTPDDIGRAAVFLCDPTFSVHTGTELRVEGGYSNIAPYLAVRQAMKMRAEREG